MGEIADMMIERMLDFPEEDPHEFKDEVQCKHCGSKSVRWEMTPAGWRLFNGTKLHECCDPFKLVEKLEKKK